MTTFSEAANNGYWSVQIYENENSQMRTFYRATLCEALALVHRAIASGNYADISNTKYLVSFKHLLSEVLCYGNGFSAVPDSIVFDYDYLYNRMYQ